MRAVRAVRAVHVRGQPTPETTTPKMLSWDSGSGSGSGSDACSWFCAYASWLKGRKAALSRTAKCSAGKFKKGQVGKNHES